jgi:hypothetical protein
MASARAEWDAQVDAALKRMREEIAAHGRGDVAVAADTGAFQTTCGLTALRRPTSRRDRFSPTTQAVIHFFEAADVSTAGHEIFHVFRRVLEDMALAESARPKSRTTGPGPARRRRRGRPDLDGGAEEMWAKAGETVLLEGRAPSLELAGAFQRLRIWLARLYRAVRGQVKLNRRDARRFRTVVAADEEIEYARPPG